MPKKTVISFNGNELNADEIRRNDILGLKGYIVDLRQFKGLTLEKLELLIKENFVELEEHQNESPPIKTYLKFLREHPKFTCHGYAIGIIRMDYRITIEGLFCEFGEYSEKDRLDFIELESGANELNETGALRSWYD